jgi:type II secretory pathway component GspD/PulD (secretin)
MKKNLGFLVGVWFCAQAVFAQNDRVVRAYPVYGSQPDAMVQILKDTLSDKASVAYVRSVGKIIVTAPESDQEVATALLKETNVPAKNVRIDVNIRQEGASSETEASVGGSGKVVVSKAGASYKVRLNPSLQSQSGTESDNANQTVMVQSGNEGRIFVGEEVPFSEWLIEIGREWGYVEQNFKLRPVGSSLVVLPQIAAGGLIVVTLTPELSCLAEGTGKMERIRYTRMATQVTIANGATLDLGGVGKDKDFYNKFLVGMSQGGERRSVQIKLTANIQDPQGQNVGAAPVEDDGK